MVRRNALHRREDHVACSIGRILLGASLKGCLESLRLALSLFGEARKHLGPSGLRVETGNLCKARIDVGTGHIEGDRFINEGALALSDGDLSTGKEVLAFAEGYLTKAKALCLCCRGLAIGLLGQFGLSSQA
jgi:hypothetical protein